MNCVVCDEVKERRATWSASRGVRSGVAPESKTATGEHVAVVAA